MQRRPSVSKPASSTCIRRPLTSRTKREHMPGGRAVLSRGPIPLILASRDSSSKNGRPAAENRQLPKKRSRRRGAGQRCGGRRAVTKPSSGGRLAQLGERPVIGDAEGIGLRFAPFIEFGQHAAQRIAAFGETIDGRSIRPPGRAARDQASFFEFTQSLGQNLVAQLGQNGPQLDRKSTRLNSSHTVISYAVFCLKQKNTLQNV